MSNRALPSVGLLVTLTAVLGAVATATATHRLTVVVNDVNENPPAAVARFGPTFTDHVRGVLARLDVAVPMDSL